MAACFGFLFPFYYLSLYAHLVVGLTPQEGAVLIAIMNACSGVGRVSLGFVADYAGRMNLLFLTMFAGSISAFLWPLSTSFPALVAFAISFGFFGGGFVSLVPVVLADFWGTEKLGGIIGLFQTSNVPGNFFGVSLGGKIYELAGPSFVPATCYSGGMMMIGAICQLMVKLIKQPPKRRWWPWKSAV